MKFKLFSLLLLHLMIFTGSLSAQTYHFSVNHTPYVDLQGGASLINVPWDDPNLMIPIGFNFELFDQSTQTLYLTEDNSFLLFASSLDIVTDLIALLGADLIDRGFLDDTMLSPITYATTGLAGNRVFTLEWENAGFFNDLNEFGTSTDYMNLQLKLYEASGDIEYHFGPVSVSRPDIAYEAEGPFSGLFENYDLDSGAASGEVILLDGDPTNPEVITEFIETYLDGTIPENTLFRFSREPTSILDPVHSLQKSFYHPNPGISSVALDPSLMDEITSPVQIINSVGKIMRTDNSHAIVELDGLSSGVYSLLFNTVNGRIVQKLSVIK